MSGGYSDTTAGASTTAAPFLKEFGELLVKHTEEKDLASVVLGAMTGGKKDAMQTYLKDNHEWYETVGKPVLKKSFELHDTKKTGVLDAEEAKLFFSHLVHEECGTEVALAKSQAAQQAQSMMGMLVAMLPPEQMEEQIETIKAEVLDSMKKDAEQKVERYRKNKDEHDAAAFKLIDLNGDGRLQLEEFLAFFEPSTDKNNELMNALGYMSNMEMMFSKRVRSGAGLIPSANCSQQ